MTCEEFFSEISFLANAHLRFKEDSSGGHYIVHRYLHSTTWEVIGWPKEDKIFVQMNLWAEDFIFCTSIARQRLFDSTKENAESIAEEFSSFIDNPWHILKEKVPHHWQYAIFRLKHVNKKEEFFHFVQSSLSHLAPECFDPIENAARRLGVLDDWKRIKKNLDATKALL